VKKKLMFVVNVDWFFISHRLPIAIEAQRQGYEVHLAVGVTDKLEVLKGHGFIVHPLSIERSHTGVANVLKTFGQLVRLFWRERPEVVHLVTIKPVLLGGIAARLAGIKCVVAAVTGLGFVFLDSGLRATLRRTLVTMMYRAALGHRNLKVIFQNPEDQNCLIQLAKLSPEQTELIRGSGVDLTKFRHYPLPEGTPIVVMAARLLKDKGVCEFVDAARFLRERGVNARCCLIGSLDTENRSSVTDSQLANWVASGVIEHWGFRADMPIVLRAAYVVVLPSYREGLPKVLIEAAATGRAVITTDVPGCRDAIEPGVTGILVSVRDALGLADAIQRLIDDRHLSEAMGVAGRELAVRAFDINRVAADHLEIYEKLQRRIKN
jgi:glycosyltransferase involved in cell wall biosynthesis